MPEVITIRPVVRSDRTAWGQLWKGYCDFYEETVADPVTEATWEKFFDDGAPLFSLVAEDSTGVAVGFVNCVVGDSTWALSADCYLEDLYVDPGVRGRGTGRALIDAVLEKARGEGWRRVYWQTHKTNTVARALYEKIAPVSDWVIYEVSV